MDEGREENRRGFRKRGQEVFGAGWGLGFKLGSCALKYKYSRFREHLNVKTFLIFLHKSKQGRERRLGRPFLQEQGGNWAGNPKNPPRSHLVNGAESCGSQKVVVCPQEAAQRFFWLSGACPVGKDLPGNWEGLSWCSGVWGTIPWALEKLEF